MKNNVFVMIALLVFVATLILVLPLGIAPNTVGGNYKNVTVQTHVNITNSKPEILNVSVFDATNSSIRNITISAGSFKTVYCNATIRDWNGFNDIIYVNASLWHIATSSFSASDDNNSHYTNSSCTYNASISGNVGWFICSFDVLYYSTNGTWMCNVTAVDNSNTTNFGNSTTTFYAVYALNITDGIDYGNVAVEDYSTNITANITNIGNMAINVTLEGYGARRNDGLAMNCSVGGNITIANERFSTSVDADWASKIPLTGTSQLIQDLTMPKQTTGTPVVNSTYWQLYLDSTNNPGGNCTGYILFTAVAP